MPGLVKIGHSLQDDVKSRVAQLYTTGVPVPFEIEHVSEITDPQQVERALHVAFSPNRINSRREFFKIDAEQAIAILRVIEQRDSTADITNAPDEVDQESKAAGDNLRRRRPNMHFQDLGIPEGAVLHHTQSDATVTVVNHRLVNLNGSEMSLTAATRDLSDVEYDQPPALYWTYDGRSLREIYNEVHAPID